MEANFSHVWIALNHIRDELGIDLANKAKIEVTHRDDDPGEGKICECMLVRCTVVKTPSNYDNFKTSTTVEYSIEVFADHENRAPRLTTVSTRDLEKREGR